LGKTFKINGKKTEKYNRKGLCEPITHIITFLKLYFPHKYRRITEYLLEIFIPYGINTRNHFKLAESNVITENHKLCLYHLDECSTQLEFNINSRNFEHAILIIAFITFYIAQLTVAILQIINNRSTKRQDKRNEDLKKKIEKEIYEQITKEKLENEIKERIYKEFLKEKTGKEE